MVARNCKRGRARPLLKIKNNIVQLETLWELAWPGWECLDACDQPCSASNWHGLLSAYDQINGSERSRVPGASVDVHRSRTVSSQRTEKSPCTGDFTNRSVNANHIPASVDTVLTTCLQSYMQSRCQPIDNHTLRIMAYNKLTIHIGQSHFNLNLPASYRQNVSPNLTKSQSCLRKMLLVIVRSLSHLHSWY